MLSGTAHNWSPKAPLGFDVRAHRSAPLGYKGSKAEMKIHGYPDEGLPIEDIIPSELAEITLVATPIELRRISEFLTFCASEMERMGTTYDHVHLSDHMKSFRNSPHFVVMRSPNEP